VIGVICFAVIATFYYFHGYLSHPVLPGTSPGWWGWFDQGQYIMSVRALRSLDLTPARHLYPIGYALIGAIFYDLMPNHPFLIPNAVAYAVMCATFILICRRLVSWMESLLLCFFGIVWQTSILENLIIPWTTIPRNAALYVLVWLGCFRAADPLFPVFSGICLGLIYVVRPGDVLFGVPLVVPAICTAFRHDRVRVFMKRFLLASLPFAIAFHAFNYVVFDSAFPVSYTAAMAANGFSLAFVPVKAFSMFINPQLLWGRPESFVSVFPYLLFALPGAVVVVKRLRWNGGALLLAQFLGILYCLAYNEFLPLNVFQNKLIHYIAWVLPFFLLYAYLSFRSAWSALGGWWTLGLFAVSAMVFLAPDVVVKLLPDSPVDHRAVAVLATGIREGECLPSGDSSCIMEFAGPKEGFNVMLLDELIVPEAAIAEVRLDQRVLLPKKGFRPVSREGSPGMSVLFYGAERAKAVRVLLKGVAATSPMAAGVRYYRTQWSLTLRNPRTLLRKLDPELYYAKFNDCETVPAPSVDALFPTGPASIFHMASVSSAKALIHRPCLIDIPTTFSLELLVKPAAVQTPYATIVGNSPGSSRWSGFSIEQNATNRNRYVFGMGNGNSWMVVGEFTLKPEKLSYIAVSKKGRQVRLWVDGVPVAQKDLERDASESDLPLRFGRSYYPGRPFAGDVLEAKMSKEPLIDEEVARRNRTVRTALQ
jgi:hypothetical protein